ncbi:MAG: iron-containing alcohol dehydrogenase [Fusobacterium necrophorum]|nr:iron-containing alcohol dehydrogenase [Fusobacterium necrophorum]
MENFNYYIPTKILFGKGKIKSLGKEASKYGENILMVYGKGSIFKENCYGTSLYQQAKESLEEAGLTIFELPDIDPNPRIESVYEGAKLCRDCKIDLVLAIGGGSTIDCAKAIAGQAKYEGDIWKCYESKDPRPLQEVLPIASILTVSATGSEMNGNSVISNLSCHKKIGLSTSKFRPVFSILDPSYTFTVNRKQTASGCVDIMSHIFEQYFTPDHGGYLQNRMMEGVLKTVIHYAPIALEHPDNYEARANLMWASTWALNDMFEKGKIPTDWATHQMEHELSAFYDITHGIGLGILTPYWMKYVLSGENRHRFVDYGREVWKLTGSEEEIAEGSIQKTREFFTSLGIPARLQEVGIGKENLEAMAKQATQQGPLGAMKKLYEEDVLAILKMAL